MGKQVLSVKASDADSGRNKEIDYSVDRTNPGHADCFEVDAMTGDVYLRKTLGKLAVIFFVIACLRSRIPVLFLADYERQSVHRFYIVATDKGKSVLSTSVLVTVVVEDANDNPPVFEQRFYSLPLSSGAKRGHFVGRVRAVDPDDGDEGKLRYFVTGGNNHQYFEVELRRTLLRV